jgi:hypothetical protein
MIANLATVVASTALGGYMVEVAQATSGAGRLTSLRNLAMQFSYLVAGPAGGFLGALALGWTALACGGVAFLIVPVAWWLVGESHHQPAPVGVLHDRGRELRVMVRALRLTDVRLSEQVYRRIPALSPQSSKVTRPSGRKATEHWMPLTASLRRRTLSIRFVPSGSSSRRSRWGATTRDGTRELLKPFDARGATPAVGYTSTVEDLGRFAARQFRLLRTNQPEVLKASTLREMQRVQFIDPGWKDTWGLGFEMKRKGDQTYVGHDGSCPGYKSILSLRPSTETGVVVMLTGMEDVIPHAAAVFGILDKRKTWDFKPPAPAKDVDLEAFSGRYSGQPWTSPR